MPTAKPEEEVVLVGIGMVTPIGLSAPETAASVRAGTMRFQESRYLDHRFQPFTVASVPDDALPALVDDVAATPTLSTRESRLLRLASRALSECLAPLSTRLAPLPFYLALPEGQRGRAIDTTGFLKLLATQTGGVFDPGQSVVLGEGRAGGLIALGQARQKLRSGKASMALICGVDSYVDLYTLGTLDLQKRVKSAVHLDGFIPGEGACALLLASASAAKASRLASLGMSSDVSRDFEKGHLFSSEPYRGDGLAAGVEALLASNPPGEPIRSVLSSMNGESHWAKEWGVAYLRNRNAFAEDHEILHPADCFGDTGAAVGALLVGLAALGRVRAGGGGASLVYASSDHGERAAVFLQAATGA
jgi:3-oxoacyl-[acyl-carrier-protein] synthase-1